ncbi:MAG TPA: hypothetical protein PK765_02305 [bacterium]|nr:hypothetical protein [bacterium]
MPFSPIRSQLDVPGSGYRGTGFPEIQLGHVSPKQATNDVESPSVATDVTERMERALAPMSEKPGHIGEARWNELQERLGEILSLASERKLS